MASSPLVEEAIALVDLRGTRTDETSVLSLLTESVTATNSGIADLFKVLVCDDLESIPGNEHIYRALLENALALKVIVVATTNGKSFSHLATEVTLPEIFLAHTTRTRILVVEDEAGLYFATGRMTPTALAVWPDTGADAYAVDIIKDALLNPEVFTAVLEKTRDLPYILFSVGTRQAWFGTVPAPAISDALTEVGKGIVGGDGFAALERRPADLVVPPVISGNASEPDILLESGALAQAYSLIQKATSSALVEFALRSTRLIIKRVANFPQLQLASIELVNSQIGDLEQKVVSLFEAVDAADGFGATETQVIEKAGIRLFREDSLRSDYRDEVRLFFDRVVDAVVSGLRGGQSMAPFIDRIDTAIDTLAPRTSEQLREQYSQHSLQSVMDKIEVAKSKVPKGLLMRLSGVLARGLLLTWNRILAATVVIVGLLMFTYDISDAQFLGKNFRDDRMWDNISQVALVVVLVLASTAAALLVYATNQIRDWGRSLGLLAVNDKLKSHKRLIEQIALNDWVLNKLRRSALEPTVRFKQCLEELMESLRSILVESKEREGVESSERVYNPAIRSTNHAGAQTGVFHNLPLVQDILRTDVVKILQQAIESHAYSLLGGNMDGVAEKITSETAIPLEKYISSVMRHGIYSRYHAVDVEQGHELRQRLIDRYWSDSDSVNRMLINIVLAPDEEPMVQFVKAETLVHLDCDAPRTCLIRFAPRPSQLSEMFHSVDERSRLSEVVLTKSASIGGVIRLIGFKEGAFN